jgi:hypothetical protein
LNEISDVESSLTSIMLADVPNKPTAAPTSDPANTDSTQIKVVYNEPADNGGSNIISYELQMDDGKGGDFISLFGADSDYLRLWYIVTTNITKGTLYRFRYRAKNDIGWSAFSDSGFILAG